VRRPYRSGKVELARRYGIAVPRPMVALPSAPDHRRIDRTRRSRPKGVDMLSTTARRTLAAALSAAAITGTIGAPAASAMPIDPVQAPGEASDMPIVSPAPGSNGPAAAETTPGVGFDVSSAAIGAAAGTGLLIVVLTAGGLASRRPTTRRHGTAGA
jgi:hypothetical protein